MNRRALRLALIAPLAVAPLAACATADNGATVSATSAPAAVATLADAQGNPRGTATVTETGHGLRLVVQGSGLPAGPHGLHIHMVGKCDAPDFTTAGSHWNPTAKQHGRDNPAGAHMGDFPNLDASADGSGTVEADLHGAALTSGAAPLLDADGAAIVIHATADDYRTDPTGNSGGRIACGVFAPK